MPGFWMKMPDGSPVHAKGDPNMSDKDKRSIIELLQAARQQEEQVSRDFEQLWVEHGDSFDNTDEESAFWWFRGGYLLRDQREDEKQKKSDTIPLTPREVELLEHIACGLTYKEISPKMHISSHTIKNCAMVIFRKLGVSNRTQAAVYAVRHGLVRDGQL